MTNDKKSKSCRNKPTRPRNFMYEQQLEHLPDGMTPEKIYKIIEEKLQPEKMAAIVHTKDTKDDGVTPAKDNLHIMMQFKNSRSLKRIAKIIGDKPQYIEVWDDNVKNGFLYLIHATKNARYKYQYSCDDVVANFDYKAFVKKEIQKQKKEKIAPSKIDGILDLIGAGELSLREAKLMLSGSDYAKYSQKLLRAHELFLEKKADKLRKEMMKNNQLVTVHWFYGSTETGKTFLAEKIAKEIGDCYLTSTTKDPFQYYQAEAVIIIDELRPKIIPYSELLSMLNPFSYGNTVVTSRFSNKPLACHTYIITTPFDPVSFYKMYNLTDKDSGSQLYRRLSSVLCFDQNYIYDMKYDKRKGIYVISDKKENLYSRKKQRNYNLKNIFDEI